MYHKDMKYLGIDYGEKRVGIAISDEEGKVAFPKIVLKNNNEFEIDYTREKFGMTFYPNGFLKRK